MLNANLPVGEDARTPYFKGMGTGVYDLAEHVQVEIISLTNARLCEK